MSNKTTKTAAPEEPPQWVNSVLQCATPGSTPLQLAAGFVPWFLYGAECDRRADPSEGDAGDPDDRRGARRLAARGGTKKALQRPLPDDALKDGGARRRKRGTPQRASSLKSPT